MSKARPVPCKELTNMDLIEGKFLCASAMSSPLVTVAVSYVLGMGGVARDISDRSSVTSTVESPSFPLKEKKKEKITGNFTINLFCGS